MSATIDTWTGWLGLLAGFGAVAAWLAVAGAPADVPAPSASVRLGTLATGELGVAPLARPVLAGSELRPGGRAETGSVSVRNETSRPVAVSVRVTDTRTELDRSAWIELVDGRRTLVREPLAAARSWSARAVNLEPLEDRSLRARVWIPARAADGWQAARGDLTLEFRTKAALR